MAEHERTLKASVRRDENKTRPWLALHLCPRLGRRRKMRLVEIFEEAGEIFRAGKSELMKIQGFNSFHVNVLFDFYKSRELDRELKLFFESRADAAVWTDPDYPLLLKRIYDPPVLFYYEGDLKAEDRNAVALVGSRRASEYGMKTAYELAYQIASNGITVVSGMARGIDTAAHKGAVAAGGRTVAVLGCGLNANYPRENQELRKRIAEKGAVLTEFRMNMAPYPGNFPIRNRIISGLSLGVVVVEAPARSGALITASTALDQDREVFAVPGRIDSSAAEGCHNLIKSGAKLVYKVEDIFEEILPQIALEEKREKGDRGQGKEAVSLKSPYSEVYEAIGEETLFFDEILERVPYSSAKTLGILTELELRGLIQQLPGKKFVKRSRIM